MRILYINHYAGSPRHGMEYRPYYLAREWVRAGHAVRVLAGAFSHVRAVQPTVDGKEITAPATEWIDGIEYRWYPTPAYSGNGGGRVLNIWVFLRQLWAEAGLMAKSFRPDVVVASSTYPMDIWVARRIARLAGARLVFEVHDLWPLSPIELSGMSPKHPFIRLCSAAEKTAYRDADVVISMLPKVHQYMASRGLDLRKLHIVPNGIAPDEWSCTTAALNASVAGVIAAARSAGRQVVGYAGSHGLPNALDTLLDAAVLLRETAVEIVLVGDGHEKERLRQRVVDEGLAGRVHLLAPIPKAQIPAFLSAIDVAYIGWQRVPIYRFGIAPNKLMDYMMAGCPVLHSIDAGNDPVAESGCGLTVAPEDAAVVANGLQALLALDEPQRRALGERGRAHVTAHHLYPVLALRFEQAMGAAVAARSACRSSDMPERSGPAMRDVTRRSRGCAGGVNAGSGREVRAAGCSERGPHDRLASTRTPTGQAAAVHAIAGNRFAEIVQVAPDQAGDLVRAIAELQAAAYSSSHFSAYLSLEKQIEFVSLLIAHADALVVAFDVEKPDDLLGFAFGGTAASVGLGVFVQRNRRYLLALLAIHPRHLLRYARSRMRSRWSSKPMSVAPFRLTSIVVRPDAQGAGIGGRLLVEFEGVARTANIVRYGLSALRGDGAAVRFYTRHGFVVETVAGDAVYMKKDIS